MSVRPSQRCVLHQKDRALGITTNTVYSSPAGPTKMRMLSQLSPIMQQLAGVDVQSLLHDISRLPGAMADTMSEKAKGTAGGGDKAAGRSSASKPASTKTAGASPAKGGDPFPTGS